jgi:hypothetical protein
MTRPKKSGLFNRHLSFRKNVLQESNPRYHNKIWVNNRFAVGRETRRRRFTIGDGWAYNCVAAVLVSGKMCFVGKQSELS